MTPKPKRRNRNSETVCRCDAYNFPHREFGGRCLGESENLFEMEEARKEAWIEWMLWQKERLKEIESMA